jgi:3-deoxy-D-manno-octulosonic-acid transferase
MARLIYSICFYLLMPVILLRLLWRARLASAYHKRISERFGYAPFASLDNCIWVHTVSVGETIAAAPVIRALVDCYPQSPVVVTTMTPTGSERVKALFGDTVLHCYVPYDLPGAVKRFISHCNPKLLLVFETELWPNLVYHASKSGAAVILANARLSERSARGYQRFAALTRPMLSRLSQVAAQTELEGERFIDLGLARENLVVTGSIKFDIDLPEGLAAQAQQLKARLGEGRPTWIAASTHQGEDELILQAHQKVLANYPDCLLVLVPRHPERFDEVARLCREQALKMVRRSQGTEPDSKTKVILGDTMGELLLLYGISDIAFVGGSLVPTGGHNMLEASVWGVPVISGPHLFNFTEISNKLIDAGGMVVASSAEALASQVMTWYENPLQRQQAGQVARSVVDQNRGAVKQLLAIIDGYLGSV